MSNPIPGTRANVNNGSPGLEKRAETLVATQTRVGLEASGQSQWFERLLADLEHQLWIGDAAKIRASTEPKQKTDRRDANLLGDSRTSLGRNEKISDR